jgi:hypothetical protein
LEAFDAIDEERPDEVELLLYLKGPEVIDVDVVQDKRSKAPQNEVCGVGEKEVLPA